MKRLIYILVAFTALLTAACSQTIVFDEINEVVPPVSTTIQDNQIWYTTTNAKVVSTIMSGVVSNTYENGKGIITFDRPIDVITVDAFYNCAELKSVQLPQTVMAIEETAFGQCTSLSSIKLSNELRNIGPQAFSGCTALASITIPDSVEQIEQRTFCDCTALKSVTFGATSRDASSSNLRMIGQCAFQNCTSLVNITLPSKLEIIAEDAFTNCASLISITIPQSVNHVENNVFIGCSSLKEFSGKFATSDSRSLVRDRELIAFAPASLTEYTIDSDVVAIVGHVFSGCNKLQTVNIPSSVESVDEFSFWGCSALKSITLPENVRFVGGSAFWQCTNLASVYCKSITPPELGNDGVFDENKSGRKIYVPTIAVEEYKRAQHWSEYASAIEADKSEPIATDWVVIGSNCSWDFATATPMTISGNYAIANGVTFDRDGEFKFAANGSWDINYGLDSSVLITAGKTYQGVLSGENIKIAAGTYNIKFSIYDATFMVERVEISTNHLIFYTSTDGNVVTPYAADVFGANIVSNTYAGDQGIITFDGDITKIGNSAFKQCNTLQAIIIPQSVTKIDHFAFTDCTNLTAINFPSGVTEIGNLAFNNCQSLESVVLPNSLTKIGTQAFYCCNSISSVTIPQSVTTISDNAFGFCASLAEFKGKFASEDGRCLVVNGTLNSFASAGVTEYTIPSSVTAIGHYAMHNSALLTTVTIPQSVQTVGDGAFNGCVSLASVYCKPTTPPTGGSAMFDNNAANRKIYVPAGSADAYKTAAGWSTYADAIVTEDVEQLTIEQFLTKEVGDVWYQLVGKVKDITNATYGNFTLVDDTSSVYVYGLTATKTDTNDQSFQSLGLREGDVVTLIGRRAEYNGAPQVSGAYYVSHESVTNYQILYTSTDGNIVTPNNADVFGATIVSNTYENGQGVITFDGEVTKIGERAFYNCSNLKSITIPDSATLIGQEALRYCKSLTSVNIGNGVVSIKDLVFSECSSLTDVVFGESVAEIWGYAFANCSSLSSIVIPNSVTELAGYVFYGCTNLTSITIPDSITTLGDNPFDRCAKLAEFNGKYASADKRCLIVDGVLNSFAPAGLTTYTIPNGITKIGSHAFIGCTKLTSINIPDSVTIIENAAFFICSGLTSVTIPSSVIEIGAKVFYNCTSLHTISCLATTPPKAEFLDWEDWSAFYGNAADRKIYVPAASVEAYKTATGWSAYADAIVAEGATSGVVDLSVAGTANCYLVNGAGNYKFKAVKGNSLENFSNGYSADVLWESFGTSTTPNVGDLITNVAYKDGYISFSTPATFKSGNASIALRDSSGKILWSWHIWCSAEGWSDQVYPNNAGTMMDRNLGATSATPGDIGAFGLLYQWGRKDPFMGGCVMSESTPVASTGSWNVASSDNMDFAVENPMTFATGWHGGGVAGEGWHTSESEKGLYDPCPVGYRLPDGGDNGFWATALDTSGGTSAGTEWDSANYGRHWTLADGTTAAWYPAVGCRSFISGALDYVGSDGYYWSASPNPSVSYHAYNLYFLNGYVDPASYSTRSSGQSVRCVRE